MLDFQTWVLAYPKDAFFCFVDSTQTKNESFRIVVAALRLSFGCRYSCYGEIKIQVIQFKRIFFIAGFILKHTSSQFILFQRNKRAMSLWQHLLCFTVFAFIKYFTSLSNAICLLSSCFVILSFLRVKQEKRKINSNKKNKIRHEMLFSVLNTF